MTFISPAHVSDEEKLMLLRKLDQFRDWHSLDDKRYCLVCDKIINGHEVQFGGRHTRERPIESGLSDRKLSFNSDGVGAANWSAGASAR